MNPGDLGGGTPSANDCQGQRPIHPETHQPLPLRRQPGYYPGLRIPLKQQAFWDEATRTKVLKRVQETPPIRFFDPREANLMEVLAAHICRATANLRNAYPSCRASTSDCTRGGSPAINFLTCRPTAMLIGSVFKPLIR